MTFMLAHRANKIDWISINTGGAGERVAFHLQRVMMRAVNGNRTTIAGERVPVKRMPG